MDAAEMWEMDRRRNACRPAEIDGGLNDTRDHQHRGGAFWLMADVRIRQRTATASACSVKPCAQSTVKVAGNTAD